jgi:hypothetical protein
MRHPFQIQIPYNDAMECYEVVVSVGGFEDKGLAENVAKAVIAYLEATEQ